MKRDMGLIRELLLRLEPIAEGDGGFYGLSYFGPELAVEGATHKEIAYHMALIAEAGLIEGEPGTNTEFYFKRLSWTGHDFLDAVRDPGVWQKTMKALSKAGSGTFDMVFDIAKSLLKEQVGKALGGLIG